MRRRDTGRWAGVGRAILVWSAIGAVTAAEEKGMRVGIIGLDTSHATAFTKLLNTPDDPQHVPGGRVVVACAPLWAAVVGAAFLTAIEIWLALR